MMCVQSKRRARWIAAAAVTALLVPFEHVAAQETRAELISQEQARKQQTMTPQPPNPVENLMDRLEDWGLIMGAPRGFYPWFGSVYSGGGIAGGAGFRRPIGDDGAFNTFGGYSMSGFSRVDAELALPTFARDHARLTLTGRYLNAADVRYFGVGNETLQDDESRFGYRPISGEARLDVRAGRFVTLGGGSSFVETQIAEGRKDPAVQARFTPADTPGLEQPDFTYVNSSAYTTFDWRKQPGYSGRGGVYRLQLDDYRDLDTEVYSFRSVEAEVLQLVPIMRANWVIALRGLATVTDLDDTTEVPFFLLPSLGGGRTLRGYPDFRFRDRNRLLMNAELRWTPARFMDMAVFYDTGKVAARRSDLDLKDLHDSYGIGMRFIGASGYKFRIELARSREHNARLIVSAGGAF